MKYYISVKNYANLCNLSERTIRRYMATASIEFITESSNRTLIAFNELAKNCIIPLTISDNDLILHADTGNAEAQNDLGLLLLAHNKPTLAIYWLNLAAKQQLPDAMQLLGNCYALGKGVEKDRNLSMMWTAKAASLGSVLASQQMVGIFPN
mgnify:CR=1 FL=1